MINYNVKPSQEYTNLLSKKISLQELRNAARLKRFELLSYLKTEFNLKVNDARISCDYKKFLDYFGVNHNDLRKNDSFFTNISDYSEKKELVYVDISQCTKAELYELLNKMIKSQPKFNDGIPVDEMKTYITARILDGTWVLNRKLIEHKLSFDSIYQFCFVDHKPIEEESLFPMVKLLTPWQQLSTTITTTTTTMTTTTNTTNIRTSIFASPITLYGLSPIVDLAGEGYQPKNTFEADLFQEETVEAEFDGQKWMEANL